MSHLRFKNLFKVIMITHATIQWSWYLKLGPNFCVMKTAQKDWKRIYKSNTNLQLAHDKFWKLFIESTKTGQKN